MSVWQCPNCDRYSADSPRHEYTTLGGKLYEIAAYLLCPYCGQRVDIPAQKEKLDEKKMEIPRR